MLRALGVFCGLSLLLASIACPPKMADDGTQPKPTAKEAAKKPSLPPIDLHAGHDHSGHGHGHAGHDHGLATKATPPVGVTVNGVKIESAEIMQAMKHMARGGLDRLPPQTRAMLQTKAEEHVITRELLKQHAKTSGLKVDKADVDKRFQQLIESMPPGKTEADIHALLGVKPDALRDQLAVDAIISKIVEAYEGEAKPSPQDVAKFFQENQERFTVAEQISASHILLKLPQTATPEQAEEIKKRAIELAKEAKKVDAKGFAALADKHSEDPSAKKNHGDLGFFEKTRMVPEFAMAAATLQKGQVSDPVKSQFGYHIIRGQGQRPAGKQKLEEVKEQITDELTGKAVNEKMEKLVEGLKAKAKIVKDEAPAEAAPPVPAKEVPAKEVPAKEVPAKEVPAKAVPAEKAATP